MLMVYSTTCTRSVPFAGSLGFGLALLNILIFFAAEAFFPLVGALATLGS